MFSSMLPDAYASSSVKYVQNGPPKVSSTSFTFPVLSLIKYTFQNPSRFSVRVFKTSVASAFPYPVAAKVDLGYRSLHRSQTAREYFYDHSELRCDISNSPPRGGSKLQPSSQELPSRAAMASEMRRETRTPAP